MAKSERTNTSEVKMDITKIENEISELDRQIDQHTANLRQLRADLKSNQAMATEARVSRDRAVEDAATLRETLETYKPDSGRIVAYEEAIQVYQTCLT